MTDGRKERDTLGEILVPASAHYGAQTQRARENFPVSGMRFPRDFIRAMGRIKRAAATVNCTCGGLAKRPASLIARAAAEVAAGKWDHEFVLDVFQTGSGTSTNMNANEVISSRANELGGGRRGNRKPIRPNEDVNRSQSSNDVIPTAIHLASLYGIDERLLPALGLLRNRLAAKASEFRRIVKVGRTHLQDAVPVTLGQEFSGYAGQVAQAVSRIKTARDGLLELPIGGTAVGTGLNAPAGFGRRMCTELSRQTGFKLKEAPNRFAAMGGKDALVAMSGALRGAAVSLAKIASDIRLISCGPRAGLSEITLPSLQPGSSIMPGKVNPVMPEMMVQVCAQVIGNDSAVAIGGMLGQLELNAMMPLMAHNLLQSIEILSQACALFAGRCVAGISADADRCRELLERSLMPVTALAPRLGYAAAADIAREAQRTGRTLREVVLLRRLIPPKELDSLLDLSGMTQPKTGSLRRSSKMDPRRKKTKKNRGR